MHCLVVRDTDAIRGLMPLLVRTESIHGVPRQTLRFWSNSHSPRINAVVDPTRADDVFHVLATALVDPTAPWDIAFLEPVPLEDETTRRLVTSLEQLGCPLAMEPGHSSPTLPLPLRYSEFEERLSARFRQSLRRKRRKAHEAGLRYACENTQKGIEHMLAVSAESWQHAAGTGIGTTDEVRRFYVDLATEYAGSGTLQIALLYDGDVPIAFELNLLRDECVYNLKMEYALHAAEHSPGTVLRSFTLEEAISSGAAEFDMLGIADEHKLHWSKTLRGLGRIEIYGFGAVNLTLHALRHRLRPFLRVRAPWLLRIARIARAKI